MASVRNVPEERNSVIPNYTLRPPGNGAPTPEPGGVGMEPHERIGYDHPRQINMLQPSFDGATNPEQDAVA